MFWIVILADDDVCSLLPSFTFGCFIGLCCTRASGLHLLLQINVLLLLKLSELIRRHLLLFEFELIRASDRELFNSFLVFQNKALWVDLCLIPRLILTFTWIFQGIKLLWEAAQEIIEKRLQRECFLFLLRCRKCDEMELVQFVVCFDIFRAL